MFPILHIVYVLKVLLKNFFVHRFWKLKIINVDWKSKSMLKLSYSNTEMYFR